MRYVLATLIMLAGFWYWMQPRDYSKFTGAYGNTMPDAEQAYYVQIFNHAMGNVRDGQSYPWESYNSKGVITPAQTYASKSRAICRRYTETYTIGQYSGEQDGVSCKRKGKPGWCRIKPGNAESCALEDRTMELTFGDLNVGTVDMDSIKLGDIEITLPDIGGVGPVSMPDGPDMPKKAPDFLPDAPKKGQSGVGWITR